MNFKYQQQLKSLLIFSLTAHTATKSATSSFLLPSTAARRSSSTGNTIAQRKMSSLNEKKQIRLIDIGANLLDAMYQGNYRGKERHEPDLELVLKRAFDPAAFAPFDSGSNSVVVDYRLDRIVCSAGSLDESRAALEFVKNRKHVYCTVGVHPTRCNAFQESGIDNHISELLKVCKEGIDCKKVVAIGELGLDYARTQFCDIESQKEGFLAQLRLAEVTGLPLFLHNRDTGTDLLHLLSQNRSRFTRGVVHSFDDTLDLANKFIDLDLYIGLNGCSLKTEENLEVVKAIPVDRILLETDCPWCDIRPAHAGSAFIQTKFVAKQEKKYESGMLVKSRYEPCNLIQVAQVVAGAKGISVEELTNICYKNTLDFFQFPNDENC